jgi:hypothetical protein
MEEFSGAIVPRGDGSRVDYEAWCRMITERPELRPIEPEQIVNPFTGAPATMKPRPDAATIVVDGVEVGDACWYEPEIVFWGPRSMLPIFELWAAELGGKLIEDPPSLTIVDHALLAAAYFRGLLTTETIGGSCSDQVVTLSLFYTGDLSADDCAARFERRSYVAGMYVNGPKRAAGPKLDPRIEARYRELIRLIHDHPGLIEGCGDLRRPADPTYTGCRLTEDGCGLAAAIIPTLPPKPEFPNWPDRRPVPQ